LSLRWFRDTFGAGRDDGRDPYERLSDEAAKAPSGSDGVLWAPYLMGERTPHLDPEARAALIGLNAKHGRSDIIRAILEGVAFSLRDTLTIFDEMRVPVREIRIGGGGARGGLWRQIQADVYGQTVSTVKAEEGAAYGAAILAGVGAGVWPNVEAACAEVVKIKQRYEPDPKSAKLMDAQYERFRRIYPALAQIAKPATRAEASKA
jgi:xylulokinase